MSTEHPEARRAAEKIQCLRKYGSVTLTDDMAAIISEAMGESEQKAMRALESLTPGGSEFVNDVERCVQHVRDRQSALMEQVRKRAHRENEWQAWRSAIQRAWAEDLRATMTALLEGGPGQVQEDL